MADPGLVDHPGGDRLVEDVHQHLVVLAGEPSEQGQVEVPADDRGPDQQVVDRPRQLAEPAAQDVLDAPRNAEPGVGRRPAGRGRPGHAAQDLFDEERVALGLLVQGADELVVARCAAAPPYQFRDIRLGQPAQLDRGQHLGPSQLGEHGVQVRVIGGFGRPAGDDHRDRLGAAAAQQVAQQEQGRPVRPLGVVDDEQQPGRAAQPVQHGAHGLEQPPALSVRLCLRRVVRRRKLPAQLGEESGQCRAGALNQLRHPSGGQLLERLPDGLDPRFERNDTFLVAAAVEGGHSLLGRCLGVGQDQAGLPDSRVAGDEYDGGTAPGGGLARLAELRERSGAAQQRPPVATDPGRPGYRNSCGGGALGRRLRPDLGDQLDGLGVRPQAQLAMQPLGQCAGGLDGRGPVAGSGQQPDELASGRLREWIEVRPASGEPDRRPQFARGRGLLGQRGEQLEQPAPEVVPSRLEPLIVEVGEQRTAEQVERSAQLSVRHEPAERQRVHPTRRFAGQFDGLPGGQQDGFRPAQAPAQFGERAAQAGAGAAVEDVRPERGRDLGSGVPSRVQRQPGEQGARPPARG